MPLSFTRIFLSALYKSIQQAVSDGSVLFQCSISIHGREYVKLMFILECEKFGRVFSFQNGHPEDVRVDQFNKIVYKCSNVKHYHLGLLYITRTIESVHVGSKHCRICTMQVTQLTTGFAEIHIYNSI
jgi:hypothetical protein